MTNDDKLHDTVLMISSAVWVMLFALALSIGPQIVSQNAERLRLMHEMDSQIEEIRYDRDWET